jgi:hypothetical protein
MVSLPWQVYPSSYCPGARHLLGIGWQRSAHGNGGSIFNFAAQFMLRKRLSDRLCLRCHRFTIQYGLCHVIAGTLEFRERKLSALHGTGNFVGNASALFSRQHFPWRGCVRGAWLGWRCIGHQNVPVGYCMRTVTRCVSRHMTMPADLLSARIVATASGFSVIRSHCATNVLTKFFWLVPAARSCFVTCAPIALRVASGNASNAEFAWVFGSFDMALTYHDTARQSNDKFMTQTRN